MGERKRFEKWWNDPKTSRRMTDFNEDQAFCLWLYISELYAERDQELVEALRKIEATENVFGPDPGHMIYGMKDIARQALAAIEQEQSDE